MSTNITMKAKDTLSAKLAKVFITIDGRRFNAINAIKLELKFEKTKTEVPILGKPAKGNRATGWKGTGSATFHYNSSIFRKIAKKYKETGEDTYFEIQVTNEDPTSSVGRQTVVARDCNLDEILLAKLDADGEYLDEDVGFTFEDFDMPEEFKLLDGML